MVLMRTISLVYYFLIILEHFGGCSSFIFNLVYSMIDNMVVVNIKLNIILFFYRYSKEINWIFVNCF